MCAHPHMYLGQECMHPRLKLSSIIKCNCLFVNSLNTVFIYSCELYMEDHILAKSKNISILVSCYCSGLQKKKNFLVAV